MGRGEKGGCKSPAAPWIGSSGNAATGVGGGDA